VQLSIEFEDGSMHHVVSDDSWRGDFSPIGLNCIYDGEDYDAQLEQPGWDVPGFDDSRWGPVNAVAPPCGKLVALDHPANRVTKRFAPVSLCEPRPGVYVFDMGTVMTGWCRLSIPNGTRGQTVTLRYAELQHDDGTIDPRTAGGARQADRYTMRGDTIEAYEPRFTYHGFRYVEVTGLPDSPDLDTLQACFVHNGVEPAGTFECGHELINRIHQCTLRSQCCNLQMGVPTDDTQRPKSGWVGAAMHGATRTSRSTTWTPRSSGASGLPTSTISRTKSLGWSVTSHPCRALVKTWSGARRSC
jgi:alpha-L-rhamnosidase